jgi:hypothetical protein
MRANSPQKILLSTFRHPQIDKNQSFAERIRPDAGIMTPDAPALFRLVIPRETPKNGDKAHQSKGPVNYVE